MRALIRRIPSDLSIQATMSADMSITFYLMGDWTNDYFSLSNGNIIDANHDTVKVY
jgi:hypothetical protein